MADRPRIHEAAHPTPFTYLKVAAALAILTGIEVGVFYVDALEPAFLPIFLILSVVKFVLVVMFYMHLKFDSRLFSGVFVGGLLLAVAVVVVLMSLFQVLSAVANPPEEAVASVEPTEPTGGEPAPPATTATPEPVNLIDIGREVYLNVPANAGIQPLWCYQCHTIESVSDGVIGPDLTHIGTDAATRKPGMSAEEYIRESIIDPEAFVAADVGRATPGLMTNAITEKLTDSQVDALVAFLLAQE